MNYLLVENISKSYGDKVLFENITFGLHKGQKSALIAQNGTGKTSLLNIITGIDSADKGRVVINSSVNLVYLPQNPDIDDNTTVIEAVFHAGNEKAKIVKAYESIMAKPESLWTQADRNEIEYLSGRIDSLDAWQYEARVKEVIGKLEIGEFSKPCKELSGGQKKKIALARVLIDEADLIILDEPTNHLDIETIEWLEEFLNRMQLTILVVTHDRYFLDKVCDSIIEIDNKQIHQYRGGYQYFLEKKFERETIEAAELEKKKSLYKKELEWIRRMPKARGTKAKSRVDSFSTLREDVSQRRKTEEGKFFVKGERIGKKILEINYLNKQFGSLKIIEDFSYTFKKGDKVGLVGKNGVGKSTLLDMVVGLVKPDKGKIIKGSTIQIAYFTQDGMAENDDRRIIDIVKDVAEEVYVDKKTTVSASKFLNMFGFDYNSQYSYMHHLSGGEKRKLHLLMSLMEQPNFLILDEPTNDLDIHTLQTLESFLENFEGCLLVASHDRYFLDKIAGHIFVFEGEGKIKDFYSTYSEYRLKKDLKDKREKLAKRELVKSIAPPQKKRDPLKPTWKELKEHELLEKEIAALEDNKDKLTKKLSDGIDDHNELNATSSEIGKIMDEIDSKTERWMFLEERISNFTN